jgi:hypothetical protein
MRQSSNRDNDHSPGRANLLFDIELLGQPEGEGERLFSWGRITLGHFTDEFQAPLYDWAPGDYTAHWLESAQRLVKGAPVVVFLTHMMRADAPYHLGWPAWRKVTACPAGRLFLREQPNGAFDPDYPEVHAARGRRSHWRASGSRSEVGLRDVVAFGATVVRAPA